MASSTEQHNHQSSQSSDTTQVAKFASANPNLRPAGVWRLRRHVDYQRAYKLSRKQFSPSMTYFFAPQSSGLTTNGARVGITAGRVLGNAVTRNRIKRRMREAIRHNIGLLPCGLDLILHPRPCVREMDFSALQAEVSHIFIKVAVGRTSRVKTGNEEAAAPHECK